MTRQICVWLKSGHNNVERGLRHQISRNRKSTFLDLDNNYYKSLRQIWITLYYTIGIRVLISFCDKHSLTCSADYILLNIYSGATFLIKHFKERKSWQLIFDYRLELVAYNNRKLICQLILLNISHNIAGAASLTKTVQRVKILATNLWFV